MRIDLNCASNEQECWNSAAIKDYAALINGHEESYEKIPFYKVVTVGSVACEGCGFGGVCGAKLTETSYSLEDGGYKTRERPIRPRTSSNSVFADDAECFIEDFRRHSPNLRKVAQIGGLVGRLYAAAAQYATRSFTNQNNYQ